jgi:hypothetical protein
VREKEREKVQTSERTSSLVLGGTTATFSLGPSGSIKGLPSVHSCDDRKGCAEVNSLLSTTWACAHQLRACQRVAQRALSVSTHKPCLHVAMTPDR